MKTRRGKSGFTLIELLTVMAIMVLVTTIAISNYFGMNRSASFRAAQDVVYNTLQMAKQRACINGRNIYVVFLTKTDFCVVEYYGTISEVNATAMYDYYPDTVAPTTNTLMRIWNLTQANSYIPDGCITNSTRNGLSVPLRKSSTKYSIKNVRAITGTKHGAWKVGDEYGIEVMTVQRAPKGYEIGFGSKTSQADLEKGKVMAVKFEPDGTISAINGSGEANSVDLHIFEPDISSAVAQDIVLKVGPSSIDFANQGGSGK